MSQIELRLDREGWSRSGRSHALGTAFVGGDCRPGKALARHVDARPLEDIPDAVGRFNGEFAVVSRTDDRVALAVDHVGSVPLFYATEGGTAYVGDDPRRVLTRLTEPELDRRTEVEFLLAGLVTGRDTLYGDLNRVPAGGVVTLESDDGTVSVTTDEHFRYEPTGAGRTDEHALLDELDEVVRGTFDRLLAVADGRQVALSLSGGYDSRLVACLLARTGYDEVLTFSFGAPGNRDAEVAERVAAELGLPWEMVEYSHDRWRRWFSSDERADYYAATFDLCSPPSIGACMAVRELRSRGVLDDDAVVVSGDSITTTGEHVPGDFLDAESVAVDRLVDEIRRVQYTLWDCADPGLDEIARERIADSLTVDAPVDGRDAARAIENWDWRERQSKFIVSPREYEYWGVDSWLPLFDREYVEFWERVPLRHRVDKSLHRSYVDRLFERQTGSDRAVERVETRPGPLARVKRRLARSPVGDVLAAVYGTLSARSRYDTDPLASFGILPREQYDRLSARSQTIHAMKVVEILGLASFDPPMTSDDARAGTLRFPPTRRPERVRNVGSLPWFV